jgi:hypothetical protein
LRSNPQKEWLEEVAYARCIRDGGQVMGPADALRIYKFLGHEEWSLSWMRKMTQCRECVHGRRSVNTVFRQEVLWKDFDTLFDMDILMWYSGVVLGHKYQQWMYKCCFRSSLRCIIKERVWVTAEVCQVLQLLLLQSVCRTPNSIGCWTLGLNNPCN